ncbi:hypothetical protein B9Z19DRAFT_1130944 [Tuber borchii]|uniref:PHD-type domain-containing protein n=1 Tax=Tuber borchii TaxID=42251 RepID=A0A2T6ZJG7_TUBBO|nr:hypothetical protein B9Z19DRAFT_1130944 [Tuber borchii]
MKTNIPDSSDLPRPELKKLEYRKITPFQVSEAAWLTPVGRTGPQRLNNPPNSSGSNVDSAMIAIGYQETSRFERPPTLVRDLPDTLIDHQLQSIEVVGKVGYDMDDQNNKCVTTDKSHGRMREKEWVTLERSIPKTVAKPDGSSYGTRRRSSGNDDEEDGGEDSKSFTCDDGECENSNAIVFCDWCYLAVHQECYGVPHIPEGQRLCRKCLAMPNKTAHAPNPLRLKSTNHKNYRTSYSTPDTDGAFKQATNTKWAHFLCVIWISEVILGNTSYMEPVDGMNSEPKSRWKLVKLVVIIRVSWKIPNIQHQFSLAEQIH